MVGRSENLKKLQLSLVSLLGVSFSNRHNSKVVWNILARHCKFLIAKLVHKIKISAFKNLRK